MYMLTDTHINQFREQGYTVIENVLTPEQVFSARAELHTSLAKIGIDHDRIINWVDSPPDNARIKSDVSNLFYSKFKLDIQINESMYLIWKELMSKVVDEFPLGQHTDVIPYIDRVCYRLPDSIRAEGGLGLHIDRRPGPNFLTNVKKYRPIQGFVSLTDHYGDHSGGLQVVPRFHRRFNDFFSDCSNDNNSGEFFRMHSKSYAKVQQQLETLSVPAGSLVLWDNRLPHATCQQLKGSDSREVIYLSYIPNVPLNVQYSQEQKVNFAANIPPPSYVTKPPQLSDRDYSLDKLTEFQKRFLV
jgi:ectoine hydroxylase-related dioxygenase (phytanoyl-CoA dioxygenase family)